MTLILIILATFLISLGGLLGVFFISMNEKKLQAILHGLVGLSTGALLGGAFLHLLPEATELIETQVIFPLLLITLVGFFLIEKILHWRHCHDEGCQTHSFGYMNLIGDALHNFIDGVVIAGAFSVSVPLGLTTTLAVALHEVPQEISDFGVLLYSGFSKRQALLANFGVALAAVAGGVMGYFMAESTEILEGYLLVIAAGSFLYIAASDLMPELRRQTDGAKLVVGFGLFVVGIIMMLGLGLIE